MSTRTDWINADSQRLATEMFRAAIRANNLNAGAEAAAIVLVTLGRFIARDADANEDGFVAALVAHAQEFIDERDAQGRPVLTVLQGGKGEDDGT